MRFSELGLKAELVEAVSACGYETPTPIQQHAIPPVLAGRDVLAGAQTGTGKTAAFTLPILSCLSDRPRKGRHPRVLVVTPTRELAAQIGESIETYGKRLSLRHTVVFGGVGFKPQADALARGVDILVATPGRLLDHAQNGALDLSSIEILVLDEADRMLDMGFIHDIRRVLALLPKKRQNLLFSATYAGPVRKLAESLLHDPVKVDVAPRNATADRVEQSIYRVEKANKRGLLSWLIGDGNWKQVLVFTRTKHGANRLAQQLERDGLTAAAIHGNKSQGARTRALEGFKNGAIRVLVATDIAARGLDIHELPWVVNYELPNVPEDYVHRIGRTARAGRDGRAVSLVMSDERPLLRDIERLIGRKLPVNDTPEFALKPPIAEERPPAPPRALPRNENGPRPGARRRRSRRRRGPSNGGRDAA